MQHKKLKTVLVGYGRMGKNHFRVLSEDSRYELVAVIDPRISSDEISNSGNLKVLPSIQQISELDFDVVVVAAPTEYHFEIASYLIPMGRPILIEKE